MIRSHIFQAIKTKAHRYNLIGILLVVIVLPAGCAGQTTTPDPTPATREEQKIEPIVKNVTIDRESKIPPGQAKITPETDLYPPLLHSNEYEEPVPVPYPINTAGAEDSAFVMPDGETLYVWFTPDPNAPLGEQLDDRVTGIYFSGKTGGAWQKPERVVLQDPGKQSLDGCAFVRENTMWFCSARTGYTGMHWFTADYIDGKWTDWNIADFNPDYEVGELHITADGTKLYFHSARAGGKGQYDIWVSDYSGSGWLAPRNIETVNTPKTDGWPSLNYDGNELWFTRTYQGSPALYRAKKINGEWQDPELIISQFAGESSIDSAGNIYFTHHFFKDGVMLEADIYVAYRK
jgi:hypothetical protein